MSHGLTRPGCNCLLFEKLPFVSNQARACALMLLCLTNRVEPHINIPKYSNKHQHMKHGFHKCVFESKG